MNTPKSTVIYHSADFDGIFCREIARKFLGESAEYIGWNHGDPLIKMPEEGTVYILDLSPDCLDASQIQGKYWSRIVWIAHHKSSIEKYSTPPYPPINGYRIDGVAACRLAWQWFFNETVREVMNDPAYLPDKHAFVQRNVKEPRAVRLAGEYDIWDKRDPDADVFQYGLRSEKLDELWPSLLTTNSAEERHRGWNVVTGLLKNGELLQRYQREQDASVITHNGFDLEFDGLKFLACNAARFNSHLFTAAIRPEHDALFGFCWDGTQWKISLYHAPGKEHHDLSKIAVKYGGGGHRGACGFQVNSSMLPWSHLELMENIKIKMGTAGAPLFPVHTLGNAKELPA